MYIDPKILEEMQKRQQQQNRFAVQEPRRINSFFARGGGFTPDQAQQEALKRGFFETQADANTYEQQQRNARNVGLGNMLYSLSDAFAGRNIGAEAQQRQANQFAMQQAQEATNERARKEQQRASLNQQIDQLVSTNQMSKAMGEYAKSDPSILGEIYKNQMTPVKGPTSYEEYIRTDDSPTDPEYAEFLKEQKSASATRIDMSENKEVFLLKDGLEEISSDREIINKNKNVTDRLYLMELLLDGGLETGRKEEALLGVRQWVNSFGGSYGDDVEEQELFDALSAYIVPRMREVGSGATSDFEANLYQTAIASLGKTPEGNKLIVKTMIAAVERDQKMYELKNSYLDTHGKLTNFSRDLRRGFDDQGNKWIEPELFKKFDMKTNDETGATDFEQAVANGELKKGQMYYNKDKNKFMF